MHALLNAKLPNIGVQVFGGLDVVILTRVWAQIERRLYYGKTSTEIFKE